MLLTLLIFLCLETFFFFFFTRKAISCLFDLYAYSSTHGFHCLICITLVHPITLKKKKLFNFRLIPHWCRCGLNVKYASNVAHLSMLRNFFFYFFFIITLAHPITLLTTLVQVWFSASVDISISLTVIRK